MGGQDESRWAMPTEAALPLRARARDTASQLAYLRTTGLVTRNRVGLADHGLAAPERNDYEPAEWGALRRALPRGDVRPGQSFVDIGCGMGRVVLLAARRPFTRAIGIDISPELIAEAQANAARMRGKVAPIEFVAADVTTWPVPDDLGVVFMNNPFTGELFDAAIARLLESLDRTPRPMRLIYRNPVEHARLMGTGRATAIRQTKSGPRWRRAGAALVVYTLR